MGAGAMTEPEYVYSPSLGRRVKVLTHELEPRKKRHNKPFRVRWVKKPRFWIEALGHSNSANTHRLADIILMEAFKATGGRHYSADEIILSSAAVPGMARKYKIRAAKELAGLGLITVWPDGRRALRVTLTKKTLAALS